MGGLNGLAISKEIIFAVSPRHFLSVLFLINTKMTMMWLKNSQGAHLKKNLSQNLRFDFGFL